MSYYTKVLLPDEKVRVVARLHWAIFLKSWLWFFLTIVALVLAGYFYQRQSEGDYEGGPGNVPALVGAAAAVIFLIAGLASLLSALIRRGSTEIVVTDRRIIFKEGVIRRRTMEMNMNKVETVDVVQTIGGRIFNFGTVLIRGVGSSYEPIGMVADPLALRTAIVAE
jgi:uncharacterized membrane protein YdbT with pleckstrin-like domain